MHLKITFKWALHFNTLATTRFKCIKKLFQIAINTAKLYASLPCDTMSQPSFKCFATCMTHSLIKLKSLVLLVIYRMHRNFRGIYFVDFVV